MRLEYGFRFWSLNLYWTFPLNDLYLTFEFRYVNWTDSGLDSFNSMFKNRLHGRLYKLVFEILAEIHLCKPDMTAVHVFSLCYTSCESLLCMSQNQ